MRLKLTFLWPENTTISTRRANYTANFSECLRAVGVWRAAGAIFCGTKATLTEIRQGALLRPARRGTVKLVATEGC
jgi:hypothetical protein